MAKRRPSMIPGQRDTTPIESKPSVFQERRPEPITVDRLELALDILAEIVLLRGPQYLPLYERLERELELLRNREATLLRVLERYEQAAGHEHRRNDGSHLDSSIAVGSLEAKSNWRTHMSTRRPSVIPAGSWPPRMMVEMAAGYVGEKHVEDFLDRVGKDYPSPRVVDTTRRKFWYKDDLDKAMGLGAPQSSGLGAKFVAANREKKRAREEAKASKAAGEKG